MKMLFCAIGWMDAYNGQNRKDILIDEKSLIKEFGYASDQYTFQNRNGYYYGGTGVLGNIHTYKISNTVDIKDYEDGVLVIWVSRKNKNENYRIVGWYKNATVYKKLQTLVTLDDNRPAIFYRIKAKQDESTLLRVEDREFEIPDVKKNGIGIDDKNIWYATEEKAEIIKKRVLDYIDDFYESNKEQRNIVISKSDLNIMTNKELHSEEEYAEKASNLYKRKDYIESLKFINRMISLDKNSTYAYNFKGNLLSQLGLYDEGIECYKKALDMDSKFKKDILFNIALTYGISGKLQLSLKCFDEYLSKNPKDKQAMSYKRELMRCINYG